MFSHRLGALLHEESEWCLPQPFCTNTSHMENILWCRNKWAPPRPAGKPPLKGISVEMRRWCKRHKLQYHTSVDLTHFICRRQFPHSKCHCALRWNNGELLNAIKMSLSIKEIDRSFYNIRWLCKVLYESISCFIPLVEDTFLEIIAQALAYK